jgi:hypothetical protein
MNIKIEILGHEVNYVPVLTTAPEAYDYSGAINVQKFPDGLPEAFPAWRGASVRLVLVYRTLVDTQCDRYASGLYGAFSGEKALEEAGHCEASIRNLLFTRLAQVSK